MQLTEIFILVLTHLLIVSEMSLMKSPATQATDELENVVAKFQSLNVVLKWTLHQRVLKQ